MPGYSTRAIRLAARLLLPIAIVALFVPAASAADLAATDTDAECAARPLPRPDSVEAQLELAAIARCALAVGEPDKAIEAVDALERADASALSALPWLPEVHARVALLRGDAGAARSRFAALYADAGAHRTAAGVRARLLYYRGLAEEADGDSIAARDTYGQLLREHPSTEYASRAQLHTPRAPLQGRDALDMARAALEARHYEAAERLLRLAACGPTECSPRAAVTSGDRVRYEAAYQLGFLLYRYRRERVAQALVWLETVASVAGQRRDDAMFAYAAATTRLRRSDEARRAWRAFARSASPGDARVEEAELAAAWLFVDDDAFDDALRTLAAFVEAHPDSPRQRAARWWVGWSQRRLGDCPSARETWATLPNHSALERAQVTYWEGVCLAEESDNDGAAELWERLRESGPFDYYGVLAARRLGVPLIAAADARPAPGDQRDPQLELDPAVRAADAGLAAEAAILSALHPGSTDAWRLRTAVDPRAWVRWRAAQEARFPGTPTTPAALEAWRLSNPEFYRGVVRSEAGRAGLPPTVVWAVMQTESSYDPTALSASDAMGLMQVIPQTALQIAARIDTHYVDGMLFEPRHAIRFGAWYLGALRRNFDGQIPVAIAAYNAGPVAVEAWVEQNAGMPLDEWVEEIAFDQARDYVRRVLGAAVRYTVATASAEVLSDPTLDGLFPSVISGELTREVDF
ncbi:MAG: transglycosylase SLT domain-containing protein [Myxococcales bacterium]|nr:transglycosylase SLT domain-containing protein [Myxococcales bacterium]